MKRFSAILASAACALGSACSTHIHKISEEGKSLCREQAAELAPGTSIDDRQRVYRQCLKTIDSTIQSDKEGSADQNKRRLLEVEQEQLAMREQWASPQERLIHCKTYREDVIRAEKERIRALGPKMMTEEINTLTSSEKEEAISRYAETLKNLDELIPSKMRAGLPLLPDSVEIFSRCLPSDFQ